MLPSAFKPKPKPKAPAQMAKSWLGKRIRTMTKDLSVTVPFSPAIVLAPSSRTGDLVAEHHPYFVSALFLFFFSFFFSPLYDFSRDKGQRRTLVEGITSDGGTEGKSANDVGPGRTSGDGGECPGWKEDKKISVVVRCQETIGGERDLPEEREAVRRPCECQSQFWCA